MTTLILLICHQIDAAYWKEWEMFLLPEGIQFFIVFNLIAFPPLLFGLVEIASNKKNQFTYSFFISSLGLATFLIHSGFYIFGYAQFNLPVSVFLILSLGLISISQLFWTLRMIRKV